MVDQQLKYIRNFLAELFGRRVKEKAAKQLGHTVPDYRDAAASRIGLINPAVPPASKSEPSAAELVRCLIAKEPPALRNFDRYVRSRGEKFKFKAPQWFRPPGTGYEMWSWQAVTVKFLPGEMKYVTGRWPTKVPPEDMKLLPDGILEALTNSNLELGETASRTATGEPLVVVVEFPFQVSAGQSGVTDSFHVLFEKDPVDPKRVVAEARYFNNDYSWNQNMAVAGLPALYQILGQDVELRFAATWKQAWHLNRGYFTPSMDPLASLEFTDTPSNRWNLDQGMAEYISGLFGEDPEMYSSLDPAQQKDLELLTRFRKALGAGSLNPDSWAKPADWPLGPCQPITTNFLDAMRHPDRNNSGLVTFTIEHNTAGISNSVT